MANPIPEVTQADQVEVTQASERLTDALFDLLDPDCERTHQRPEVLCLVMAAVQKARADALEDAPSFQQRVAKWAETCFPPKVVQDRLERRDRLVEEALELAQTLPDFTADRAHALVDYVFSRPVGATEQEIGGVSVTLAALCHAEGVDQQHWAEAELARISKPEIIEKIRAKQAAKPVGSALPVAIRSLTESEVSREG